MIVFYLEVNFEPNEQQDSYPNHRFSFRRSRIRILSFVPSSPIVAPISSAPEYTSFLIPISRSPGNNPSFLLLSSCPSITPNGCWRARDSFLNPFPGPCAHKKNHRSHQNEPRLKTLTQGRQFNRDGNKGDKQNLQPFYRSPSLPK
ncbi:hypothetical protein RRG08_024829 [Elysia crispata]|uniref:Uncharacterized protein n=1 Tax=Elysia crispata TaxID=231223 RepID=A0AAE1CZJ5_9GAST|nr:hypothetical protein RRG08_024829 [Elysia crispata]